MQVEATALAEPLAHQVNSPAALKLPQKKVEKFSGLDGDDVRHPLDAYNTRLLRRLPGLDFAARSLMGKPRTLPYLKLSKRLA